MASITETDVLRIAQAEAERRGWVLRGPVRIERKLRAFSLVTSSDNFAGGVSMRISAKGRVLSAERVSG